MIQRRQRQLFTLPGDADTWSVTVFLLAGDPALKALRDPARWTALVRACPLHAYWLDGEPLTDVLAMAGVANRYRRFVVDGAPVATGIVSVGDAWACTNPIGGRGISMGLMHVLGTMEVVRDHLDDLLALALAQDAMTEARLTPWYRNTVAFDRQHTAQIDATIHGRSAPRPADPAYALRVAMLYDAELFRAFLEIISLLALPQEVMARPGVRARIVEVAGLHDAVAPPGPSRDELLPSGGLATAQRAHGPSAAGTDVRGGGAVPRTGCLLPRLHAVPAHPSPAPTSRSRGECYARSIALPSSLQRLVCIVRSPPLSSVPDHSWSRPCHDR
jgi:hypothetical protein